MSTTTHGILETIRTATESRDAAGLARLYADDAEVSVIDRSTPPSSPRVLHGKGEVVAYLEDTCTREMTHEVRDLVEGDGRIAAHGPLPLPRRHPRPLHDRRGPRRRRADRPADDRPGLGRVSGPAAGAAAPRAAGRRAASG